MAITAVALYDYAPQAEGDLALKTDDLITVTDNSGQCECCHWRPSVACPESNPRSHPALRVRDDVASGEFLLMIPVLLLIRVERLPAGRRLEDRWHLPIELCEG